MAGKMESFENALEKKEKVKISPISPEKWEKYKELKLEALRSDPQSFSDVFEEEAQRPDEDWKAIISRAQNKESGFNIIAAREGERFIGMVGHFKRNPKAFGIYGLYVNKGFRGKGVGDELMKNILELIEKNEQCDTVELMVNQEKREAVELYKRFGFNIVVEIKDLKMGDGKLHSAYTMVKRLKEKTHKKSEE